MAIDVSDHEAVLERFDSDKKDLPKMQRTDAALKQMDVEAGDVIEIQRDSPTAGKAKYYRRVVEP